MRSSGDLAKEEGECSNLCLGQTWVKRSNSEEELILTYMTSNLDIYDIYLANSISWNLNFLLLSDVKLY